MSINDSITIPKLYGSGITSAWANAMQAALGGGTPAQPAKFTVFYDTVSGTFKARNGTTGAITYNDADFIDVVNPALLACTTGGRVHVAQSCTGAVFASPIQILQDATWLTLEAGTSLVNTGAGDGVQIGDSTHTVNYSGIDGMGGSWINRAVNGATNGIHLYDAHVCIVRNINVNNHDNSALKIERSWESRVYDCDLRANGGDYIIDIDGINGNQSNNLYIAHNWIRGGAIANIDVTGWAPENILLYHNGITDGVNGVVVHDAGKISIINNYFEANTDKNIYLQGDTFELVSPRVLDNWINIFDAADYGVYIGDTDSALIQQNHFTLTDGPCIGIYVAAAATKATIWPNTLASGVTNTIVDTASLKVNGEHQIEIIAGDYEGKLVDNAGWETSGACVFTFDPDLFPPIISIKLRSMMYAGAHPALVYTKLYNATHAADVAGAQNVTIAHSTWENLTTADFKAQIPTGPHDYTLMYVMDTNNGYVGRVALIVQTN